MAIDFFVHYVFESVSRDFMRMNEVHVICNINSSFHSLGELSNFIAISVHPNFLVFWVFYEMAVFEHVAIPIHHVTR